MNGRELRQGTDVTKRGLKKKLSNPFALVAQGFAVGSLLFFATLPDDAQAQAVAAPVEIPVHAAR